MHTQSFYIQLATNIQGRDFFVGDLHGRYDQLMTELDKVGFDYDYDRLISVGDLVDRGEQSELIVSLIEAPWFYAVRGNHDQFILDQYEVERIMLNGVYANYAPSDIHKKMAGNESDWFYVLDEDQRKLIATKLMSLPYVLEVTIGRFQIGVCHAAVPWDFTDWTDFLTSLADRNIRELTIRTRKVAQKLAKGKDRILNGIDFTLHGHCTYSEPLFGQSSGFIDTFDQSGRLTLLSAEDLAVRLVAQREKGHDEFIRMNHE